MTISNFNRVELVHGPTPIERLNGLSNSLGRNIFIKRDDCTGLGLGGNKARKLEYLIADALGQGADTLVTCGGIQSNHARQTAAAAAKFGLKCVLVLEAVQGTPNAYYPESGNILLDQLFGADIVFVSDGCLEQTLENVMTELSQKGAHPYLIPMGGSSEIGSLGYVDCALEMYQQLKERALDIDLIVHASGSAGTQAGLVTGLNLANSTIPVLGICVSRSGEAQQSLVWQLCCKMQNMFDFQRPVLESQIKADGRFYGDGYGICNDDVVKTIRRLAAKDAILLDPVYTAKAMHGLITLVEQDEISAKNILFLHTGGAPGLFAYQSYF